MGFSFGFSSVGRGGQKPYRSECFGSTFSGKTWRYFSLVEVYKVARLLQENDSLSINVVEERERERERDRDEF